MNDLTNMTADARRRIVDEYLDAVFGDHGNLVADRMRMGAPELPEDPTADQVAAWVELVELLRDPDFVASTKRMVERTLIEAPVPRRFAVRATYGCHRAGGRRSSSGHPARLARGTGGAQAP